MQKTGRILSLSGGLYTVKCAHETMLCYAKGAFRREGLRPVVGDRVLVDIGQEPDSQEARRGARGVILEVLPRKNVLIRPPLANLDTLFLVTAVKDPAPVLLSLDKLLSIAIHNKIEAIPVFTKKDLDPAGAEALCALYRKAGFQAFAVSSLDPEETKRLLYPCIRGQICGVAGASGAGKSTLLNTLFPALGAETGSVSEKTQRGRHTTRQSTLYDISALLGRETETFAADTPGFSLLDFDRFFFMEKEDLAHTFPEFAPHFGACRYTKCSHQTEDGCKILEEVKAGRIAQSRHESYVSLFKELSKTKSWELDKKKNQR